MIDELLLVQITSVEAHSTSFVQLGQEVIVGHLLMTEETPAGVRPELLDSVVRVRSTDVLSGLIAECLLAGELCIQVSVAAVRVRVHDDFDQDVLPQRRLEFSA